MTQAHQTPSEIDISAYWLPFTPNRYFHQHPKIMHSAKGATLMIMGVSCLTDFRGYGALHWDMLIPDWGSHFSAI